MKERSRTEYSLINMLTGVAGYAINTIVGFVCRIVFVRVLSAEYLGVSGLFSNILSVLLLAELGISSAIIYALYKPIAEDNKEKIASIMQFYRKAYMAIGLFVAVVGLSLLPFLKYIVNDTTGIHENIYVLYLLYLLSTVSTYFFSYRASLLTAMQRQYIVSGYNYVITVFQSILQIVFLLLTHEYITYLIIQVIGGIIYNIWVSSKASHDYPYILTKDVKPLDKTEKNSLLKNIKALAINKVSGVLVNSTDNLVINYFTGLGVVGLTSNYTLLSGTLGGIIGLVFNALPGSVGNLNATADKDTQYRFFKTLNLLNFWLFGWGAIGIAFVSSDLVAFLFGSEYVLSAEIPLIIAINSYTIGMLQASYTYKSTLGLFRYGQYLLFLTGLINLGLDIFLGKIWGTFGILLATLIARMCTNLWYEPYAVFKYGLNKNPMLYFLQYCRYATILLFTGAICWVLCSLCHFSLIVNVVVKIFICSVIPNAIFTLVSRNREEFIYLMEVVKRIINKYITRKG